MAQSLPPSLSWAKRIRHLGHAAVQQNHIKGPRFRRAAGERAFHDRHVGHAELLQGFPGGSRELRLSLHRGHRTGEARDHGGRIAGGAADIEHGITRLDRGKLDQAGSTTGGSRNRAGAPSIDGQTSRLASL